MKQIVLVSRTVHFGSTIHTASLYIITNSRQFTAEVPNSNNYGIEYFHVV